MNAENTITVPSWFGPARVFGDEDPVQHRPWRKVRGQRRYYRVLPRDAVRVKVQEGDWYDRMHWHVDWPGLGNTSWRARRSHLDALFVMYRHVLSQTATWSAPHQVWLAIDPVDSSQDAVYLHTPNPNCAFPIDFGWVQWDADVPARLREFMSDPDWQFGRMDEQWTHFFIRVRPAR